MILNHEDQFGDRISLVGDGIFPRLPPTMSKEIVERIPHQLGYPIDSECLIADMVAASVTAINHLLGEDLQERLRPAQIDYRSIEFEDGTNVLKGTKFHELLNRPTDRYLPSLAKPSANWQRRWDEVLNRFELLRSKTVTLSCTLLQQNVPAVGNLEFASISKTDDKQSIRGCSGLDRGFGQLAGIRDEPLMAEHAFVDVEGKKIATSAGEAYPIKLEFSRQYFIYEISDLDRRETFQYTEQFFEVCKLASATLRDLPRNLAETIWRHWPQGFTSKKIGDDSLWYDALFELAFNKSLSLSFRVERFVGISKEHDPTGRIQLTGDGLYPRIPTNLSKDAYDSLPNQLGYPDYFEATIPDLSQASIDAINYFIGKRKRLKTSKPRVFILYAEDSEEHIDDVESLTVLLRKSGIDAIVDIVHLKPSDDYLSWTANESTKADLVVVVISNGLFEMDRDHRSTGERVRMYPQTMTLYSILETNPNCIIPVLLPDTDEQSIPDSLLRYPYFRVNPDEALRIGGHEQLIAAILEKSKNSKVPSIPVEVESIENTVREVEFKSLNKGTMAKMIRGEDVGQVDFLVINPLAEERDAILDRLPGYAKVKSFESDTNSYFASNLSTNDGGKYQIVVLPLTGMGLSNAASATSNAIQRWKPRFVLVVGIAGGVAKNGVDIGDVLISDQIADYELQKIENGESSIRWQVHRADNRLLNAAMNFLEKDWQSVKSKRFNTDSPKVHFGPICTGNKVIADDSLIDQYREVWSKMIGVEMEGGGVANAVWQSATQPGMLMIRGVSDLADGKKGSAGTKRWRPYACEIAASWTIDFLKSGPVPLVSPPPGIAVQPIPPNIATAMPLEVQRLEASEIRRLLVCLSQLPSPMFNEVVFRMTNEHGMKSGNVAGAVSPQADRAIQLLDVAKAQGIMEGLYAILMEMNVFMRTLLPLETGLDPSFDSDSRFLLADNRKSDVRTTADSPKRFAIALLFPGEHRKFVEKVAEELSRMYGRDRIFYDEWYEVDLLGTDGELKLQSMYDDAELIIPFFSKHYEKPWCSLEWLTIHSILLLQRKKDRVIPVHMDETKIPGWQPIDFGINLKNRTSKELGALIQIAYEKRAAIAALVPIDLEVTAPISKDILINDKVSSLQELDGNSGEKISDRVPIESEKKSPSLVPKVPEATKPTTRPTQAKIFVSHSSKDKPFVRKLVDALAKHDLPIWFDEHEIDVGDSIVGKVNRGLEDASYLIVVYSKESVESYWVQSEVNSAFVREMSNKSKVILPVVIDDCKVPPLLQDRLWADFRGDFSIGLNSLLRVLEQERSPSGLKSMLANNANCIPKLQSLSLADVRHLMKSLDRSEVSGIWLDVWDKRMDQDLPRHVREECVIELLGRASERGKLLPVYKSICRNHRGVVDQWFLDNI